MGDAQLSLFKRKTFPASLAATPMEITPPLPEHTVMRTLPAYYAYLLSESYSRYTPRQFLSDVASFAIFIREKPLKDLTIHDIYQWIVRLKAERKTRGMEPYTEKTINRKFSAINNYFFWIVTQGILATNPAAELHIPKIISPLPDILFESECQQLLVTASTKKDSRTYLILLLLLETGIKKEELRALRLMHFDFSNRYAPEVWIKHSGKKKKKDRKLKLPPETEQVFHDYVSTYHVDDTLFPYTSRLLEEVITTSAKRAEIKKRVTASILRDTYAVRCLKRGEDIEFVLKKLGLSETTWEDAKEKYLKLTSQAL